MKVILFCLFLFILPSYGVAQQKDTLALNEKIDSLLQLIQERQSAGEYQEMLNHAMAAGDLVLLNKDSLDLAYVECLFWQAKASYHLKNHDNASIIIEQAIRICENRNKFVSLEMASYLNLLGLINKSKGNYSTAETLLLRARDIREKLVGKDHAEYAETLGDLGVLYFFKGEYANAVSNLAEAKIIRQKLYGTDHPEYATNLNNLAAVYMKMGDYEYAEPEYLEAISLYEKKVGKEHPNYANSLNNLAVLYFYMGKYNKAEPLYLEAKGIQEKSLGKEDPAYATSLNNLGNFYSIKGDYFKAEKLMIEAKNIREKALGKDNAMYAISLHVLADLYKKMGNYDKALPLMVEGNEIFEKSLGKEHSRYGTGLNRLAALNSEIGKFVLAESLYMEALTIRKKVLGDEHPDYATSLSNLGVLYGRMKQYEKAESLLLESKSIRKKTLGNEHPSYAESLSDLAELYRDNDNVEKATELFLEAKSIRKLVLGENHPDYVKNLKDLAIVYYSAGEYEKARPYFISSNLTQKKLLESGADHLSGVELQKFLLTFEKDAAIFSSFVHDSQYDDLIGELYDNNLFYKGFLLSNALRIEQSALNAPDDVQKLYYEWKAIKRRLASQYSKPIDERKHIAEFEEQANTLEKTLLSQAPLLKETRRQVNWQDVREKIREIVARMELAPFRYTTSQHTDSVYYMALLLCPDDSIPKQIFLFEQQEINSLLKPSGARRADYVNDLYSLSSRGDIDLNFKSQKTLSELIWKPLKEYLSGVKIIYFSPSGLLHRINLGAIPIDEEDNLASRYDLFQLNTSRNLVFPPVVNVDNDEVMLYGGVYYDSDTTKLSDNQQESRGDVWTFLKGTEKEVRKLEIILRDNALIPSLLSGTLGTEESFKELGAASKSSPRILHIATHGYFYPDPEIQSADRNRKEEPVFKISEQAMLRSGLILAGANKVWVNSDAHSDTEDDGILTALEISQLNLNQTELVVLSACETGLGEIQGSEGVYGLQRAFKIAGAKYIMMSLWQVPDKQTANLMQIFYSYWLEDKLPIRKAFATAQREMWDMGFDPYFWAGFVLVE